MINQRASFLWVILFVQLDEGGGRGESSGRGGHTEGGEERKENPQRKRILVFCIEAKSWQRLFGWRLILTFVGCYKEIALGVNNEGWRKHLWRIANDRCYSMCVCVHASVCVHVDVCPSVSIWPHRLFCHIHAALYKLDVHKRAVIVCVTIGDCIYSVCFVCSDQSGGLTELKPCGFLPLSSISSKCLFSLTRLCKNSGLNWERLLNVNSWIWDELRCRISMEVKGNQRKRNWVCSWVRVCWVVY